MRFIQPTEFKEAFLKVAQLENERILENWCAGCKAYTSLIRELLPKIAEELNIQIYNGEYYTLDAVLYESKNLNYFPIDSTYVDYIAVALEHENQVEGSEKEMNKLQHFNTPLKVLITYTTPKWQPEYLKRYKEIIDASDVFNDIATLKRQLVIFGDKVDDVINWSFYYYSNKEFEEI